MAHRPLNAEKMAERKKAREAERASAGTGAWLNLKEAGQYMMYIAGPSRDDDDLNYIELTVAYGLGADGKKRGVVLDSSKNPLLLDERVVDFLTERDVSAEGPCPLLAEWEARKEGNDKKGADDIKPSARFIYNIIPFGFRKEASEKWGEVNHKGELCKMEVGQMVWEGIVDAIIEAGDITDPDAANLVVITKSGSGMKTKYKVTLDTKSVKKPIQLSDEAKAEMDEKMVAGGDHDLYKTFAEMVKSREQLEALLTGVDTEDDDDDDDDDKAKPARTTRKPLSADKGDEPDDDDSEPDADADEPAEDDEPDAEPEVVTPPPKKGATATTSKPAPKATTATPPKGTSTPPKKDKPAPAEDDDDGTAELEKELARRKAAKK